MNSVEPNLNFERELPSGEKKEIVAPIIADLRHQLPAPKGIKFFWHTCRWLIIFLFLLELMVLIFATSPKLSSLAEQILSPLSFLAQVLAFILLSAKFLKQKNVNRSFLVPFFCAFLTGLLLAIVKIVWYNRAWALYNLALEPLWWLVRALVVAIIINIIYKIYQLLIFKKEIEPTLKIN